MIERGRQYPKLAVHKAIAAELGRLGYQVGGAPKKGVPAIDIDQLTVNSVADAPKDADDYEVTLLLDVMTREKSQARAYEVVADIRANLSPNIEGYVLQNDILFEDSISLQEVDDEGELQREEQRIILTLTKI